MNHTRRIYDDLYELWKFRFWHVPFVCLFSAQVKHIFRIGFHYLLPKDRLDGYERTLLNLTSSLYPFTLLI
jgi:hypothetical protein